METKLLGLFLILGCSAALPMGSLLEEPHPDTGLSAANLILQYGYPVESHVVATDDGYILTILRIPHGLDNANSSDARPPALLVHGLHSSSADWVNMGSRSLGFILADAGYDVWLANVRGTDLSKNHTTIDPEVDKAQFWNYSWHEIGVYDVPVTIDHILETTGEEKLHYVGHSQGCTSFLVMTSVRPEYNGKIKVAALLAPAALFENNNSSDLHLAVEHMAEIQTFFNDQGIYEVPFMHVIREFGTAYCWQANYTEACLGLVAWFGGGEPDIAQLDPTRLSVIATNAPNAASLKQLYHYGQQIANGGFSQYDYGPEQNTILYGTPTPPPYDLSKITAPVALYYGNNDGLAGPLDVEALAMKLPNLIRLYKVKYDLFNHLDFIFAIDVEELLYNEVVTVIGRF